GCAMNVGNGKSQPMRAGPCDHRRCSPAKERKLTSPITTWSRVLMPRRSAACRSRSMTAACLEARAVGGGDPAAVGHVCGGGPGAVHEEGAEGRDAPAGIGARPLGLGG